MRKMKFILFFVAFLVAALSASAQISHGGEPLFNFSGEKVTINQVAMPFVDNDFYLQQDIAMTKGAGPMRVGVLQKTEINVLQQAKIVKDSRGTHFLLEVQSENATFVSLKFSSFKLPDGAELFFYDRSGDFVLGSFNAPDVKEDGSFFTQSIPGDAVIIEYNVPQNQEPGELVINEVCHGYKELFSTVEGKGPHGSAEGSCHINVACPEGDDWRDQIRSVVALEIMDQSYAYMCSGALVNNTNLDRTPYVLSAFHCQELDFPPVSQIITYFLYETSSCTSTSGFSNKSVTGATILAKNSYNGGSDFMLLRLNSNIPNNYRPYYAGWDRSASGSNTVGCCVHHPGGDYKKISIPSAVNRISGQYSKFFNVYWFTGANNKGVTEEGSSGSPLFNADRRIIGQLFAGGSSCADMASSDLYGRFYYSWTGAGSNASSLQSWLDPTGSGVTTLDGLDYKDNDGIEGPRTVEPKNLTVYPNPSNGMVHFDVSAIGDANYKVFDMNGRCVKEGRTILTTTEQAVNLGSLPKGVYTMYLYTSNQSYVANVIIVK